MPSYYDGLWDDVLALVVRHICSEKQAWNYEADRLVELNDDKTITLTDDIVSVHPHDFIDKPEEAVVIRNNQRLYDLKNRTFYFRRPFRAGLVRLLSYAELPDVVQRWAYIKAARIFTKITNSEDSNLIFTQEEEDRAKAVALETYSMHDFYNRREMVKPVNKRKGPPIRDEEVTPPYSANALSDFYEDGKLPFFFNLMENEDLLSDAAVSATIVTEANGFFTGNFMKWRRVLVNADINQGYDFTNADIAWNFSLDNNKFQKIHNLMWQRDDKVPIGYPVVNQALREEANRYHFSSMLTRYDASTATTIVDVWNEMCRVSFSEEDLTGDPNDYILNFDNPLIPNYTVAEIAGGYAYARQFAPSATFTLNDFKMVGTYKGHAAIALAEALNDEGATIDVVSDQGHLNWSGYLPTYQEWADFATSCTSIGCKFAISELDISVEGLADTETKEQFQYDYVSGTLAPFLWDYREHIHSVSFWGSLDPYSWLLDRYSTTYPEEQPLPFGPNGTKKPFYEAFFDYFTEQINA